MNFDQQKFDEVFKNAKQQYEVVIDSDIYLVNDYKDGEVIEVYKKFLDQDIRWVNLTPDNFPRIIIPVEKEGDYKTPMDLVRKFLGQISFENSNAKTPERERLLGNRAINPQLQGNRKLAQLGLPYQFLYREDNLSELSDFEWLAFSIFREAVNTSSEFYRYFNLYKITQIPFIIKDKNGQDKINMDKFYLWVDNNLDDESKEIMGPYLKSGQKYGQLLKECRDSIGHVEILSNGTVSVCPDKTDDYLKIEKMNDVIKNLAIKTIHKRLKI
jgi:hypothetical protein